MKGRSCGTRRRALAALAVLAPAVAFAGRTFEPPGAGMAGAAPPAGIGAEGGPGGELRPGVGYVAGEVLVTFRPEVAAGLRSDVVRARGDRMAKGPEGRPRMARVAVRSGRTVPEAVRAYRTDPRIEHAQPNFLYYAQRIPDDPGFPLQWGLRNTGQSVGGVSGLPGSDIAAPAAWETRTDCTGIPVAVLDTGINYAHADLAANMWDGAPSHGRDFVGDANDDDPIPSGGTSHGTHVAGTIAAVGSNSQGVAGVCWSAEIMAVRVLDAEGHGTTADLIEGIQYAVGQGARVINLSLVGVGDDQALLDALANARDNGVLVVTAAGNGGIDWIGDDNDLTPRYPCSFGLDNIICVAALDPDYTLADYSNYGSASVDVGGPGSNVVSLFPGPVAEEDFSAWSLGSDGWEVDPDCLSYSTLVNPGDWCSYGDYAANLDARAYRTYDLTDSRLLAAGFAFYLDYELGDDGDSLTLARYAGAGDPFANGGVADGREEGPADSGGPIPVAIEAGDCLGSQCSLGFRLVTDAAGSGEGVAVTGFILRKVVSGATQGAIMSGTSMATPHVAGIAALAWSYKPGSGYARVRDAVLRGGDPAYALDGKTVTGRAVDAEGALRELNEPPTVADASLTVRKGETGAVTLSASDPEGDPLTWSVGAAPAHGTASVDSGGTATYTPEAGYAGGDAFAVVVADDKGNSAAATVAVTIEGVRSGGGGGTSPFGCSLAAGSGRPDPVWGLLLLVPWILRRRLRARGTG